MRVSPLKKEASAIRTLYKFTETLAHSRYDGALQGDFIYTFKKISGIELSPRREQQYNVSEIIVDIAKDIIQKRGQFNGCELHVEAFSVLIPVLVDLVHDGHDLDTVFSVLDVVNLEKALVESKLFAINNGKWGLIESS